MSEELSLLSEESDTEELLCKDEMAVRFVLLKSRANFFEYFLGLCFFYPLQSRDLLE